MIKDYINIINEMNRFFMKRDILVQFDISYSEIKIIVSREIYHSVNHLCDYCCSINLSLDEIQKTKNLDNIINSCKITLLSEIDRVTNEIISNEVC